MKSFFFCTKKNGYGYDYDDDDDNDNDNDNNDDKDEKEDIKLLIKEENIEHKCGILSIYIHS